jgi:tRNA (mo5U34)-methyltransferase
MNGIERKDQVADLREEIIRLGPWHLDVQVTPEISTRAFLEAPAGTYAASFGEVSFINPRDGFRNLLQKIYPGGLAGRTMLDCACNCGGYSFWAKELGANECFGFDVRRHWIDQAHFLAANRMGPTEGVRFEKCELYDLPKLELKPFDITIFKGIFYHLPDPITGLRVAADHTEELIIVDTATRNNLPDGMLAVAEESTEQVMSGVHGLNWFPTGPAVLTRILNWMGFVETRCVYWHTENETRPSELGRLQMIASRKEGLLEQFESDQGRARI